MHKFDWSKSQRDNPRTADFAVNIRTMWGTRNLQVMLALQLKHNTLVKHSASLRDRICCDLYTNENATPLLVAFKRQEAVNQCAEEAELISCWY